MSNKRNIESTRATGARHRVVVIGNGMVGHRFCEKLRELDPDRSHEIVVVGEEPRTAYDRVHLSEFFSGKTAQDLELAAPSWYADHDIALHIGERVIAIDRSGQQIETNRGRSIRYDTIVLATGSSPFVPPVEGRDRPGVFVYRTIEDLEAISSYARTARTGAVLGGGLLGLEAAKALVDMGLETHVVEFAPRLMPRQTDPDGGEMLAHRIRELGVHVHVDRNTREIIGDPGAEKANGKEAASGLVFSDGERLDVDMVVVSAGIRPNDELAKACGLQTGERGGVAVGDDLRTSDPRIFAIGEVALHGGSIYGLVGPGYQMAACVAGVLTGSEARFTGADLATKLKLLGVDVASFGEPTGGSDTRSVVFCDYKRGIYKKLLLAADDQRLLGGVFIGDASRYPELLAMYQGAIELPEEIETLLFEGLGAVASADAFSLPDSAQICSCNDVSQGAIRGAICDRRATDLGELKRETRAGTGCGGCLPQVEKIMKIELAALGQAVVDHICEHFPFSRQQLFEIVKIMRFKSFPELLAESGTGVGCEVCKPAVASILASLWNEPILDHATIQDTNDRFLANIQRGGTYSIIPRVPGGEITPQKLIALGKIALKYDLYTKITGGQRVDLLGARIEQLPDIWEDLVNAGFESGHAYGKALRTIKSCVGTNWCRFGVQDSTALAIRIEQRYRGIRSPHKLKGAVSGCIRECAEAQSKDFGVIATENGWNLYVGGNGGSKPRHAELLASDLDDETLISLIDRYLMYYIHTADRLMRTARWIESLPGGLETLREVIVEDALGIAEALERDMQELVDSYMCEWTAVVRDPEARQRFRHFANNTDNDDQVEFVIERSQKRPADWPLEIAPLDETPSTPEAADENSWVPLIAASAVPANGGVALQYGEAQIALFRVEEIRRDPSERVEGGNEARNETRWYATQNACPHKRDMVLSRGIVGDEAGRPKIACPQHKRTFCLQTGVGLSDPQLEIATYPVDIRDGQVHVLLPPASQLAVPAG